MAHVDAGKTSLTERLLHAAGVVDTMGRVDDGTTQTDTLDLERRRGITIRAAVVSFVVGDVTVNIVDTPGHPDFIAEVDRVLGVLDGAVLVISAVEGVQAQTGLLLRALRRQRVPALLFLNKVDRTGADPDRVLRQIADRLTPAIVPLAPTFGAGGAVEVLAEHDDDLLAAYVAGERVSDDRLHRALVEQTRRALVHPVLAGSAITGAGIDELMEGITTLLPAAEGRREGPPSGTVFKVERGPSGEKVAYVRLFTGELHTRDRLDLHRPTPSAAPPAHPPHPALAQPAGRPTPSAAPPGRPSPPAVAQPAHRPTPPAPPPEALPADRPSPPAPPPGRPPHPAVAQPAHRPTPPAPPRGHSSGRVVPPSGYPSQPAVALPAHSSGAAAVPPGHPSGAAAVLPADPSHPAVALPGHPSGPAAASPAHPAVAEVGQPAQPAVVQPAVTQPVAGQVVREIRVFERGGARRAPVVAGQIAQLRGLADVQIGDTFGDPRAGAGRTHFAPPTLEAAMVPVRAEQKGALHAALVQLAEQDPLIALRQDAHELYVSLYGEVQKQVIRATLAEGYGIDVELRATTVVCVERPIATGHALEVRGQSGNPFAASVGVRISPAPTGSGVDVRSEVEPGSIPAAFHTAVEQVIRATLRQGLHGWDVTDAVVTVTHCDHRPPPVPVSGFRRLTPLVTMAALARAGTVVCEPVHRFRLDLPDDTVAGSFAALAHLDAVPLSQDARRSTVTLEGEIRAARLHELQQQVPGLTRGEGILETAFAAYRPVTGEPPSRPRSDRNPLHRDEYLLHVAGRLPQ